MLLVSVDNRSSMLLVLANDVSAADGRLVPPLARTLALGTRNEGVELHSGEPGTLLHLYEQKEGRPKAGGYARQLFVRDGVVWMNDGGGQKRVASSDGREHTNPRSIELLVAEDGQLSFRPMEMPPLAIPKLRAVKNGLPFSLRLENRSYPSDAVSHLLPGAWTGVPGDGGDGIEIPECRDEDSWKKRRIRLVPQSGTFELGIFRIGYDIVYSTGSSYAGQGSAFFGGSAQGTGDAKALVLLGENQFRLIEASAIDEGAWDNWPVPKNARVIVHADSDFMTDYVERDGAVVPVRSHVTHIEVRDGNNRPIPGRKVQLTSDPAAPDALVNGRKQSIPAVGHPPLVVETGPSGIVALTHPTATLAAPTYRVAVLDDQGRTYNAVDIQPAERIGATLSRLKTVDDWRNVRNKKGKPVVQPGKEIPGHAAEALRQIVLTTIAPLQLFAAPGGDQNVSASGLARIANIDGQRGRLNLAHYEGERVWGFEAGGGSGRFLLGTEAAQQLDAMRAASPGVNAGPLRAGYGVWPVISSLLGFDFLKFVCEVNEEGMKFMLELAEGNISFIVTRVSEVFQGISWVICKVFGITMDDVADWLADALDLDATRATFEELRAAAKFPRGFLATGVKNARELALNWLDDPRVDELRRDPAAIRAAMPNLASQPVARGTSHRDAWLSSPAVQWSVRTMSEQLPLADLSAAETPDAPSLLADLEKILSGTIAELRKTFGEVWERFGTLTFDELVDYVVRVEKEVLRGMVKAAFAALEHAAMSLEDVLVDCLNATAIEIPILSRLYETCVGEKAQTTMDLCCFIVAIPATLIRESVLAQKPAAEPLRMANEAALRGPWTPPDATYSRLGMSASVGQMVSWFLQSVADTFGLVDNDATRPQRRVLLGFKLAVDMITYGVSMGAVGKYRESHPNSSPREAIDIFIASYQIVFRLKDLFRLATFNHKNSGILAGAWETLAACPVIPIACVGLGLEAQEPGVPSRELAAKGVQVLSNCVYQFGSAYKEIAMTERKNAPEIVIAFVASRLALLGAVGPAGAARAAINFDLSRHFVPLS